MSLTLKYFYCILKQNGTHLLATIQTWYYSIWNNVTFSTPTSRPLWSSFPPSTLAVKTTMLDRLISAKKNLTNRTTRKMFWIRKVVTSHFTILWPPCPKFHPKVATAGWSMMFPCHCIIKDDPHQGVRSLWSKWTDDAQSRLFSSCILAEAYEYTKFWG